MSYALPLYKAPALDVTSPLVLRRPEATSSLPCVAHKVYTYHSNCGCLVDDLFTPKRRAANCRKTHQKALFTSPHKENSLNTSEASLHSAITALSTSKLYVWAGFASGDIKILDTADGDSMEVKESAHSSAVTDIVFCGDVGTVTAGLDGKVMLWTRDGIKTKIHQFTSPVAKLVWCEEARLLVACSDKEMTLHSLSTDGTSRLLLVESEGFSQLALNSTTLVAAQGGNLSVWSVERQRAQAGLAHHSQSSVEVETDVGRLQEEIRSLRERAAHGEARCRQQMASDKVLLDKLKIDIRRQEECAASSGTVSTTRSALGRSMNTQTDEIAATPATQLATPASVAHVAREVKTLRQQNKQLQEEVILLSNTIGTNQGGINTTPPITETSTPRRLIGSTDVPADEASSLTPTRSTANLKRQVNTLLTEVENLNSTLSATRVANTALEADWKNQIETQSYRVLMLQKENEFLRGELLGSSSAASERLVVWESHMAEQHSTEVNAITKKLNAASERIRVLEEETRIISSDRDGLEQQLARSDVAEADMLRRLTSDHDLARQDSQQKCDAYVKRIHSLEHQLGEMASELDNRKWLQKQKATQTDNSFLYGVPVAQITQDQDRPLSRQDLKKEISFSTTPTKRSPSKPRLVHHDPADAKHVAECLWCSGRTYMAIGGTFGVNEKHSPKHVAEHPEGSFSHPPSRSTSFQRLTSVREAAI